MPIYEYRCTRCEKQFEIFQKINDRPLRRCRDCSGPLEKLISRTAFQLKGTGWYVTDYARKGAPEGGAAGGEAPAAGEKEPAGKSGETKKAAAGKPAGKAGKSSGE